MIKSVDQNVSVTDIHALRNRPIPLTSTCRMASGICENEIRWMFIPKIKINVEKSEYKSALEQNFLLHMK